jgi:hypothetical protein
MISRRNASSAFYTLTISSVRDAQDDSEGRGSRIRSSGGDPRLGSLLEAQLDNAEGIRHLMMRDPKTGKFERLMDDAKQIDKALKTKNAFWIYTNDPNVQAFSDLLNRAIDKPAEHVQVEGGGSITIRWQTDEKESSEVDELSEDERIRNKQRT